MKLRNFFKPRKKQTASAITQILNGNEILPEDHPNVIYLAVDVVSEYGKILENTSGLSSVSEEALPFPKKDIQKAIELLLSFLNKKKSWDDLKEKYPDLAESIINNSFYQALRTGYVELAKFIPKDDSNLCLKATIFFNEPENRDKTDEQIALSIKENPWLNKAMSISIKIEESKGQRLKHLKAAYGEEDYIFAS